VSIGSLLILLLVISCFVLDVKHGDEPRTSGFLNVMVVVVILLILVGLAK
jgi:hypothetical protein